MAEQQIGPDGHPIPEVQGVVNAVIQPIDGKVVVANLTKAKATARGVALYLPQFEAAPQLQPGTEAKDDDGNAIAGTGVPVPESIVCKAITLEKAREAAIKLIGVQSKMELNELSVDLLNLAYAVLHYGNKGGTP